MNPNVEKDALEFVVIYSSLIVATFGAVFLINWFIDRHKKKPH